MRNVCVFKGITSAAIRLFDLTVSLLSGAATRSATIIHAARKIPPPCVRVCAYVGVWVWVCVGVCVRGGVLGCGGVGVWVWVCVGAWVWGCGGGWVWGCVGVWVCGCVGVC